MDQSDQVDTKPDVPPPPSLKGISPNCGYRVTFTTVFQQWRKDILSILIINLICVCAQTYVVVFELEAIDAHTADGGLKEASVEFAGIVENLDKSISPEILVG